MIFNFDMRNIRICWIKHIYFQKVYLLSKYVRKMARIVQIQGTRLFVWNIIQSSDLGIYPETFHIKLILTCFASYGLHMASFQASLLCWYLILKWKFLTLKIVVQKYVLCGCIKDHINGCGGRLHEKWVHSF